MKTRILILLFVSASAIYIAMWIAYWVLRQINIWLDSFVISPKW